MQHFVSISVVLTVVWTAGLTAQEPAKAPRRDAKKGDFAAFPLGVLGGRAEVLAGERHATVLAVAKRGVAARAGLRVGDHIVAAFGREFEAHSRDINVGGRGPMAALGTAIERAEREGEGLVLTVKRRAEKVELQLEVAKTGGFALGFPTKCEKSAAFYDGICRDLLRTRRKDGAWRAATGEDATRYTTALCGLALLGRGDPKHRPALDKVARFLAGPKLRGYVSADHKAPAGLSNWFICASGMFLAEYILATGDARFRPALQHQCDTMVARMSETGRFGHGLTPGYGGKGFNVINTHAQLLWALAKRAGCRVDRRAWRRSRKEIERSTGENGGVRYWTLQTGYWDACARTGQAALALSLMGEMPKLARRMGGYLAKHHLRMREAHAMGSIGMIFGTAALRRVHAEGWRVHMDAWRWYLNLMRQADGSAEYVGGKRNNGGDHYLRMEHVANAVAGMMLASGWGKLHMCGNDRRNWLVKLR